jgi:hypothetical protein
MRDGKQDCQHRFQAAAGSSLQLNLEAIAMPAKTKGLVEPMSLFASGITGKQELVALRLAALFARMFHHRASNATPSLARVHSDIFHNSRSPASLREIVHNEQFVRADHYFIDQRDEDVEPRISPEDVEMCAGFFVGKIHIADVCGVVKTQNCRNILLGRFPNYNSVHEPLIE